MPYSKYSNTSTDELVSMVFNAIDPDPLAMELATRLIAADDELDCFNDSKTLAEVLEQVERRAGDSDRRQVRVEGGRREND